MRTLAAGVLAFCGAIFMSGPASADAFPPLIATWGTTGSGPGQLQGPGGVCTDGSAFLYIADQGNNRIQKWSIDGTFVAQWGQVGTGPGDLYHPTRVHLAPNGEIYVAEHQNHRLSRFTRDGQFLGWFGESGAGRVTHPVGIATDSAGNIYVVGASTHRVTKFASNGTFLRTWGGYGFGNGQLASPYGVAVGPDGLVYVSDYEGCRIQKFTADGAFVQAWGGEGTEPGKFVAAEGIAFDSAGDVYVADTGNDRVQKFTPNGAFLGDLSLPHATDRPIPSDLVFDAAGNLYVIGAGSWRVYVYGTVNHVPDCSAAVGLLERNWPPNHRLVPVEIDGIVDADGDPLTVRVSAITQDEPLQADDQTCPDAVIDAAGAASVRIERLAPGKGGNGRVYRLEFEASDGRATCSGSVAVCVPITRGGSCVDPVVNSLGPCKPDFQLNPEGEREFEWKPAGLRE